MKAFILLISISLLLTFSVSKQYEENPEEIQSRLDWLNSHTQNITSGRIVYKYSNQTGIYCEATRNIEKKEFVFQINKNYVLSYCKIYKFKI